MGHCSRILHCCFFFAHLSKKFIYVPLSAFNQLWNGSTHKSTKRACASSECCACVAASLHRNRTWDSSLQLDLTVACHPRNIFTCSYTLLPFINYVFTLQGYAGVHLTARRAPQFYKKDVSSARYTVDLFIVTVIEPLPLPPQPPFR